MRKKINKKLKCGLCGGDLIPQTVTYDQPWGEKLYRFTNVPALVCSQCGDPHLTIDVAREIDRIIKQHEKPEGYEKVPIFSLQKFVSHRTAL